MRFFWFRLVGSGALVAALLSVASIVQAQDQNSQTSVADSDERAGELLLLIPLLEKGVQQLEVAAMSDDAPEMSSQTVVSGATGDATRL